MVEITKIKTHRSLQSDLQLAKLFNFNIESLDCTFKSLDLGVGSIDAVKTSVLCIYKN